MEDAERQADRAVQSDVRLLRLMTKRVGVALREQRDGGTVRSAEGPGQMVLWKVAR